MELQPQHTLALKFVRNGRFIFNPEIHNVLIELAKIRPDLVCLNDAPVIDASIVSVPLIHAAATEKGQEYSDWIEMSCIKNY